MNYQPPLGFRSLIRIAGQIGFILLAGWAGAFAQTEASGSNGQKIDQKYDQKSSPTKALREIPVLEGGRVKPFDTFARETLTLITGKDHYQGTPAIDVVMTWLLAPDEWGEKKFILIDSPLIRKSLGLPDDQKYYSPSEVEKLTSLSPLFGDLNARRAAKEKLDPYFQSVARLENELISYREWTQGRGAHLLPDAQKDGETSSSSAKNWKSLSELTADEQSHFAQIAIGFSEALAQKDGSKLTSAVQDWKSFIRSRSPNSFEERKIQAELFYNQVRPFRWAWILYLSSTVIALFAWIFQTSREVTTKTSVFYKIASIPLAVGFLFHLTGFGLRIYLTERAPVSNMYETVVWVGLGALVFSLLIYRNYRWNFLPFAGAIVAGFCLLLSDFAPAVLDGTLQPLEPVLRSNYWLTIHVLTITLSYAAFFLAFALSDAGLYLILRNEKGFQNQIQKITLGSYRAIQVGVALLAPGIILGGIWADYSWGRFWGWDPKETWALIVLLGYLAILHARMGGLLKQFGLIASSVLAFNLVIMAWYGVNFVLGAGKHSYGFGAGGIEYVAFFVALHFAFVAFVAVARKSGPKKVR